MPSLSQAFIRLRPAFSPPGSGSLTSLVELERVQARDLADGQVRRDGHVARRAVHLAARQLLPRAPERREDRVGLRLADVGDEVARRPPRLDARLAQRRLRAPVARHRERRGVGGEVDGGRVVFARQLRPARARASRGRRRGSPPRSSQRGAQLLQRLEHELGAAAARDGVRAAVCRRARTPARPARRRRARPAAAGGRERADRAGTRRARSKASSGVRVGAYAGFIVELVRDFPLFPLGLVALPSELIPLHIFEERYKAMVARCWRRTSEFGIVWLADDGLRPIGCACEIAEMLERMPGRARSTSSRAARACSGSSAPGRAAPTRRARSSSSTTATRTSTPGRRAAPTAPTPTSSSRRRTRRPEPGEIDAMTRLRDGGDRRVRARRQAGPARPALRDGAA